MKKGIPDALPSPAFAVQSFVDIPVNSLILGAINH
jgi:hypothetical protein